VADELFTLWETTEGITSSSSVAINTSEYRLDAMVRAYNPSYLGDRDQEDRGSRPAWTKSSQDFISTINQV
jgi:hypothetical protein